MSLINVMNRLGNCKNPFQGGGRKVLCVCSAGLLRSPTAALVLSQPPFNYNTRAAGVTKEFALIPVDEVLVEWADEIVVMEQWMADKIKTDYARDSTVLKITDNYSYRDPKLITLIHSRYLNGVPIDDF